MTWVKLDELIIIKKGKKHTMSSDMESKKSTRVLFTEDLRSDEKLKYTSDHNGTNATIEDLLIAWDGANAGLVGAGKEGFVGSTLGIIQIIQPEILNPQYLKLFIEKNFNFLQKTSKGAVIPHLNKKALINLSIPLISMDLQHEFIKVLNNLESLREQLNEKISLIEEMRLSIYYHIIKNSKKTKKISELIIENTRSIRSGPFGSALKHSEFTNQGYAKVLGIDNISSNDFKNIDRYISKETFDRVKNFEVFRSDVIVTIMGTIGKSAVVPDKYGKAVNTKHLVAITVDQKKINPHYLSFSIHSNHKIQAQIDSLSRGAIMKGLNLEKIKKLKIPIPSKELQDHFEIIQKESQGMINLLLKNIEELDVLKKNILIDTFSKLKTTEEKIKKYPLFIKKIKSENLQNNKMEIRDNAFKSKLIDEAINENSNNQSIKEMLNGIKNNDYGEQDKYDDVKLKIFSALKNNNELKQIFDEASESIVLR